MYLILANVIHVAGNGRQRQAGNVTKATMNERYTDLNRPVIFWLFSAACGAGGESTPPAQAKLWTPSRSVEVVGVMLKVNMFGWPMADRTLSVRIVRFKASGSTGDQLQAGAWQT